MLLAVAFPEGGWAPFPFTAYLPIPLFAIACLLLLPREQRALRWGAALYALGATLVAVVETPMGGTAPRLGMLFGGPLLLCVVWPRLRRPSLRLAAVAAVGFALLGYWQWTSAIRDIDKALHDPAAAPAYFQPLREFLLTLRDPRPDRDPVHQQSLGERRGGVARALGARLAAPARHRPAPDLLPGRAEPVDVSRVGWRITRCGMWRCRRRSRIRARIGSGR